MNLRVVATYEMASNLPGTFLEAALTLLAVECSQVDTDHRLSHWEDWREKLVNLFSAAVVDEQPDEDGVADLLGDTPGAGAAGAADTAPAWGRGRKGAK